MYLRDPAENGVPDQNAEESRSQRGKLVRCTPWNRSFPEGGSKTATKTGLLGSKW